MTKRCAACNGIVRDDGQAYDWELTVEHPGRFDDAPWLGWRCVKCARLFPARTDYAAHDCQTVDKLPDEVTP